MGALPLSRGASATAMWAGREKSEIGVFGSHLPTHFQECLNPWRAFIAWASRQALQQCLKAGACLPRTFGTVNISTLKLDSLSRAGLKCREPQWGSSPAHTCRDRWFFMPRSPARIRVWQKKKAFPWWTIWFYKTYPLSPTGQPEESLHPEAEKEAVLEPASHSQ